MSSDRTPKPVSLFNTLTRKVEQLVPLSPEIVKVYCCGPTVYNYQHIGNLRTYIFEDVLTRTLRAAGYNVKHVMNITDVGHLVSDADEGEDKMMLAAKKEGKKSEEIAEFYTKIFFEHCAWLNIQRPDIVCKATEHITQMIELISSLERNGFAYQAGGNVYFDVCKFERYGQLAQLNLEDLKAGARIEIDSNKRHPLDFALWFTKSKFENQDLQWDSPWGRGYPGWHIECSAMSIHHLGESFDIHCGGIDHIPVHHTNEIAQSEGATGKKFCQLWMHGGFLVVGKDKMSKSTGGFLTLDKIKEHGLDPMCYRLFCMSGSYRNELAWSWEALESSSQTLRKLKNSVLNWREQLSNEDNQAPLSVSANTLLEQFKGHCFNDLSLPNALAVVHETMNNTTLGAREKILLFEQYDEILGLGIKSWQTEEIPNSISELISERETARKNKNWKEADRIRNLIAEHGYSIEDSSTGTKVKKL